MSKDFELQPVSRPRRTTGNLGTPASESEFPWVHEPREKEEDEDPGAKYWGGQVVHSEEECYPLSRLFNFKKK